MKNSRIWTGALAAGIIACLTACTQPSNTIVTNKPSEYFATITVKDDHADPIFTNESYTVEKGNTVPMDLQEVMVNRDNNDLSEGESHNAFCARCDQTVLWMKTVDGGKTYSKFSIDDFISEDTTLVPYYCDYKNTSDVAYAVPSADPKGVTLLLVKPNDINTTQKATQSIDVNIYKNGSWTMLAQQALWADNNNKQYMAVYNYPFVEKGDRYRFDVTVRYGDAKTEHTTQLEVTALSGLGNVTINDTGDIFISKTSTDTKYRVGFKDGYRPDITNKTGIAGYISYAPHTTNWDTYIWLTTQGLSDPYSGIGYDVSSYPALTVAPYTTSLRCQVQYHIEYKNIDYKWILMDKTITIN